MPQALAVLKMEKKEKSQNKAAAKPSNEKAPEAKPAKPRLIDGESWVLITQAVPSGLNVGGDPQRRLTAGKWYKVSMRELAAVKAECGKGLGKFIEYDKEDPTKIPLEG